MENYEIIIIIGQSGSGKTTLAKEILGEIIKSKKDIVKITECKNYTGIGDYTGQKREKGTDTLPYNSTNNIIKQIKKLNKQGIPVLLEGDRITNKTIFEEIKYIGAKTKLFLVTCSLRTSMERLKKGGSKIKPPFLKMTKTKSRNLFIEYKDIFHGEIINTEGYNENEKL